MIAISQPHSMFGTTHCGGYIPHEVIDAAEKLTVHVREIDTKQRELQWAAEAEFLAECKQGWHEPRRRAFPLPSRRPPLVPTAFQRRFRRHHRQEAH